MAKAIINVKLKNCVKTESAGIKADGRVNTYVKALLENKGYWKDEYRSKSVESVLNNLFDLVVTVCDSVKKSCPVFPKAVKTIHKGFEDPSGKVKEEYEKNKFY